MSYSDGPVQLALLPAAVVLIMLLGFAVDYFTVIKPSLQLEGSVVKKIAPWSSCTSGGAAAPSAVPAAGHAVTGQMALPGGTRLPGFPFVDQGPTARWQWLE